MINRMWYAKVRAYRCSSTWRWCGIWAVYPFSHCTCSRHFWGKHIRTIQWYRNWIFRMTGFCCCCIPVDIYWVDSVRPFTTSAYTKMPRDYKRIPRHVIISHFHFYSVKCIFLAHGLRRTIDTMPMKVAAVVMQPMQLTAFIATKMWKLCSHTFPSSHC